MNHNKEDTTMQESTTVTIPAPLKALVSKESRGAVAIQGAAITSNGREGCAVATNGHALALVAGLDVEGPAGAAIVGRDCLTTRKTGGRIKIGAHSSECEGPRGTWKRAENVEGKYVPFVEVLPDPAEYGESVTLNASYIMAIASALRIDGASDVITLHINNKHAKGPVLITGRNRSGLGLIMPCSGDGTHELGPLVDRCRAAGIEATEALQASE